MLRCQYGGHGTGTYQLTLLANPKAAQHIKQYEHIHRVPVFHDLAIAPVKNAMLAPAVANNVQCKFSCSITAIQRTLST